jgi:hypothetical protein
VTFATFVVKIFSSFWLLPAVVVRGEQHDLSPARFI